MWGLTRTQLSCYSRTDCVSWFIEYNINSAHNYDLGKTWHWVQIYTLWVYIFISSWNICKGHRIYLYNHSELYLITLYLLVLVMGCVSGFCYTCLLVYRSSIIRIQRQLFSVKFVHARNICFIRKYELKAVVCQHHKLEYPYPSDNLMFWHLHRVDIWSCMHCSMMCGRVKMFPEHGAIFSSKKDICETYPGHPQSTMLLHIPACSSSYAVPGGISCLSPLLVGLWDLLLHSVEFSYTHNDDWRALSWVWGRARGHMERGVERTVAEGWLEFGCSATSVAL